MSYVLRRDDGAFVAPPGEPKSYTRDVRHARRFATRQAAQSEACGNEQAIDVLSLLRPLA